MKKLVPLVFLLLTTFLSVFGQRSHIPPRDPSTDPCVYETTLLWAIAPYENVVQTNVGAHLTFKTMTVCGATSYIWTTMEGLTVTTPGPNFSVGATELVWLPPGGCDDFNSRIDYGGGYNTTMSVRASNTNNTVTIPVRIMGVRDCTEIGDKGFYPTDPPGDN